MRRFCWRLSPIANLLGRCLQPQHLALQWMLSQWDCKGDQSKALFIKAVLVDLQLTGEQLSSCTTLCESLGYIQCWAS